MEKSKIWDLFDEFFDGKTFNFYNSSNVNYKSSEEDNNYILRLSVPGVKKENLKVKTDGENLIVKYEKPEKILSFGFDINSFEKKWVLPNNVENKKISSKYQDGVLIITIPKKEESIIEIVVE